VSHKSLLVAQDVIKQADQIFKVLTASASASVNSPGSPAADSSNGSRNNNGVTSTAVLTVVEPDVAQLIVAARQLHELAQAFIKIPVVTRMSLGDQLSSSATHPEHAAHAALRRKVVDTTKFALNRCTLMAAQFEKLAEACVPSPAGSSPVSSGAPNEVMIRVQVTAQDCSAFIRWGVASMQALEQLQQISSHLNALLASLSWGLLDYHHHLATSTNSDGSAVSAPAVVGTAATKSADYAASLRLLQRSLLPTDSSDTVTPERMHAAVTAWSKGRGRALLTVSSLQGLSSWLIQHPRLLSDEVVQSKSASTAVQQASGVVLNDADGDVLRSLAPALVTCLEHWRSRMQWLRKLISAPVTADTNTAARQSVGPNAGANGLDSKLTELSHVSGVIAGLLDALYSSAPAVRRVLCGVDDAFLKSLRKYAHSVSRNPIRQDASASTASTVQTEHADNKTVAQASAVAAVPLKLSTPSQSPRTGASSSSTAASGTSNGHQQDKSRSGKAAATVAVQATEPSAAHVISLTQELAAYYACNSCGPEDRLQRDQLVQRLQRVWVDAFTRTIGDRSMIVYICCCVLAMLHCVYMLVRRRGHALGALRLVI